MAKRLIIDPHWLHELLMDWAFSSFPKTGGLGFPTQCAYLTERVQKQATSREPWSISRDERDQVALAIGELDMKHRLALTRAYKPWTIIAIAQDLEMFHVTDQTWRNWCRAAAQELETKLEHLTKKSVLLD